MKKKKQPKCPGCGFPGPRKLTECSQCDPNKEQTRLRSEFLRAARLAGTPPISALASSTPPPEDKKVDMTYGSEGKMTDGEALFKAKQRFGEGAVIGRNNQEVDKPLHVGKRVKYDVWAERGTGKSWEECFASVKPYPNFPGGVPPRHLK